MSEQEQGVEVVLAMLRARSPGVAWTNDVFGNTWRALRAGGFEVLVDERGRCAVNKAPDNGVSRLTKYLMGRDESDKRSVNSKQFFRPKAAV